MAGKLKAYVVGPLKGDYFQALKDVQETVALAGFDVLRLQDAITEKTKPLDALKAKDKLLNECDFVVRLWTDGLPLDETGALELVKPAVDKSKPVIIIVIPPVEVDALPSKVRSAAKYVFDISDFDDERNFAHAFQFVERDLTGKVAPEED